MSENKDILKLLLQHHGELFGFVRALVRDVHVAEDIFQNVAVAVTQAAEKNKNIENFQAWSKEVARRQVLKYFRDTKRKRIVSVPVEEMQEVISSAVLSHNPDYATRLSEQESLRDCLEQLPKRSRLAVKWRFQVGEDYATIAERLERREPAIRKLVSRARKILFDCLSEKTRQFAP